MGALHESWLRHAAARALEQMGWAPDEIASYIQGHTGDAEKSRRVSYIPLPNVSGPYPDGRIRRVMIVEPPTEMGRGVRALERVMIGRSLTDESGKAIACLAPRGAVRDVTFEQYVPSGQDSTHMA